MNVSSTISRVNGIKEALEYEIGEQLEQIKTDLAVLDYEKRQQQQAGSLTPDQLKEALNILTYCWVNMDGEQFEAAMDPEKKTVNYWLGKFRIMQRDGWSALWCNVDPDSQNKYSNAIIKYYNQQKESK